MNKHGWVPIKLVIDTEIGISYNLHTSQIFLFGFFSQSFKNVKTILSSRAMPKQVAGWIWPKGQSLLT